MSYVDDYRSYLQWPRIHFSGYYRADISTVNNEYLNFNTGNVPKLVPTWNPAGSGEWNVRAKVTRKCPRDGVCKNHLPSDPDDILEGAK